MKKYLYSLLFTIFILSFLIGLFYFFLLPDRMKGENASRKEVPLTFKSAAINTTPHYYHKKITRENNQQPVKVHAIKKSEPIPSTKKYQFYYVAPHLTVDDSTKKIAVTTLKNAVTSDSPATPSPTNAQESLLKYVLFSINYDKEINARETESLRLTMSPRNKRINLEKALQERKINKNQINDIEKIEKEYKYVSAKLVTNNQCLHIYKIMPEEDKVYLPNINESVADQVWQWDLTAPSEPSVLTCQLSLFVRFCKNQHDCIPTYDPDKEIHIRIHIEIGHQIYSWLTHAGTLAGLVISIITLISLLGAIIWRKQEKNKRPPV